MIGGYDKIERSEVRSHRKGGYDKWLIKSTLSHRKGGYDKRVSINVRFGVQAILCAVATITTGGTTAPYQPSKGGYDKM